MIPPIQRHQQPGPLFSDAFTDAGSLAEFPCVIGVVGDFAGSAQVHESFERRKFVDVDAATIDSLVGQIAPGLRLLVDNVMLGDGSQLIVDLRFRSLADFSPAGLTRQIEPLRRLAAACDEATDDERQRLAEQIQLQLAEVVHAPKLLELEGHWRSLAWLVNRFADNDCVQVRFLQACRRELIDAFVAEPDDSPLLLALYDRVFSTRGAAPFSLLVADYQITNRAEDLQLVEALAAAAAAAFCPLVAGAAAELLGLDQIGDLAPGSGLVRKFSGPEYAKWRSLAAGESSRHVTLALPRVMARAPHQVSESSNLAGGKLEFDEVHRDGSGNARALPDRYYAWMNAAYVLAAEAAGKISGGSIEFVGRGAAPADLPSHPVMQNLDIGNVRESAEIDIPLGLADELCRLGLAPLASDGGGLLFPQAPSIHHPPAFHSEAATANARLAATLPFTVVAGRLLQMVMALARDWPFGDAADASQRQECYAQWLAAFVGDDRTRFPLAEAHAKMTSNEPGWYDLLVSIKPWLPGAALAGPVQLAVPLPPQAV